MLRPSIREILEGFKEGSKQRKIKNLNGLLLDAFFIKVEGQVRETHMVKVKRTK